jgi:hypothetical protein
MIIVFLIKLNKDDQVFLFKKLIHIIRNNKGNTSKPFANINICTISTIPIVATGRPSVQPITRRKT